jgi:hypothetical protein
MNRNAIAPFRSYVGLLVFLLAFVVIGCAGGSYSSPTPQAPEVLSVVQGAWEIQFHSAESNDYTVLELNLSQTGTKVSAGATGALLYHGTTLQTSIPLTSRGSKCDSGVVGQVTLDGMLTNQQSAAEKITFALTETGVLGTALITATASTDGAKISDGTYSIPAACGFPADHGTFTGYKDSLAFGSTAYSGTLNSGADAISAKFTPTANSFDLTMSGTDNGANFVLTGSTVGFSVALTGTVGGKAVNWFGLYDPTYNQFTIYDPNDHLVGTLSGVGDPWGYSRASRNS